MRAVNWIQLIKIEFDHSLKFSKHFEKTGTKKQKKDSRRKLKPSSLLKGQSAAAGCQKRRPSIQSSIKLTKLLDMGPDSLKYVYLHVRQSAFLLAILNIQSQ